MKFVTKQSFPYLLSCLKCHKPPQNPRMSNCGCNLYCKKCAQLIKKYYKCPICKARVLKWLQFVPKFYLYLLKNIMVKCQICKAYQPSLKFQSHQNKCQQSQEKDKQNQQFQQYLISLEGQGQTIDKQDRNLTEMEIQEFESIFFNCQLCKNQITGLQLITHYNECLSLRIKCDEPLCLSNITRENYKQHKTKCLQNLNKYYDDQMNLLERAESLSNLDIKLLFNEQRMLFFQSYKLNYLKPIFQNEDTKQQTHQQYLNYLGWFGWQIV